MPMVKISLGLDELSTGKFYRAVLAEFFGTLLFLMCVTCVALPWGNSAGNTSANNVEIGIGIGLSIATLAQAFGHVSGGHLNPAVSFGMIFGGRVPIVRGLVYMVAQVVGGIAGAAITYGATDEGNRATLGRNALGPGVTTGQGCGLEFMFTFILVFFVFSITDPKKNTEPYGTTLGIGVCIWVCHVCLIPFTGCGINPARSFGPAAVTNVWDDHWIYWVGPLPAGIAAAFIYNFIFYVEDDDDVYEDKEIPLKSAATHA